MSEWQPIETAPTDGSEVLLFGSLGSLLIPDRRRLVGTYSRGWWSDRTPVYDVTYWMPLPRPPAP